MGKAESNFGLAPNFEALDTHGQLVRLLDFRGQVVVLAFLRGFA